MKQAAKWHFVFRRFFLPLHEGGSIQAGAGRESLRRATAESPRSVSGIGPLRLAHRTYYSLQSSPQSISRLGEYRSTPRQIVTSPTYVSLAPITGGFLSSLSEGGLAMELFGGMVCEQVVQVGFDLPNTGYRIEAVGQIAWTDESARRAGLKFLDIPGCSRRKIRHWIRLQTRHRLDLVSMQ
jgi:PilZ domain